MPQHVQVPSTEKPSSLHAPLAQPASHESRRAWSTPRLNRLGTLAAESLVKSFASKEFTTGGRSYGQVS